MPWSINEAVDVLKWLIETHGGNDDLQAWRQICAYIAEAEKSSHNNAMDAIALAREFKRNHHTGAHHGHVMSEFIAWVQEQQHQ